MLLGRCKRREPFIANRWTNNYELYSPIDLEDMTAHANRITRAVKFILIGAFWMLRTALVAAMLLAGALVYGAELAEVTDFPWQRNPGALEMYRYVPEQVMHDAPLVVLLHGCRQDADTFARSGWLDLAASAGVYLLAPEQSRANNPFACWNWFLAEDNQRGSGEAGSIINMIDKMREDFSINEREIFIVGLSAGGWMTASLLAAYPDLFAGGAVIAGGPAYCASVGKRWWDPFGWWTAWRASIVARACMDAIDRTPAAWAAEIRKEAAKGFSGAFPRLSVWHGSDDEFVAVANLHELVEQWTALQGIDQDADTDLRLGPDQQVRYQAYKNAPGEVLVERYVVSGMPHAAPIDSNAGSACGEESEYVMDVGFCAPIRIARFWGIAVD